MLKERARILAASIFLVDLALVAAAFLLAFSLRSWVLPRLVPQAFPARLYPLTAYLPLLPLALAIWGALLLLSGRYRSHRTVPLLDESWAVLRVCASGTIIFTLALYLLRIDVRLLGNDQISRAWVLLFGVFASLLLLAEKLFLRISSRYVRSRGFNYRTVLIVGTNPAALKIADSIHGHRFWGYRILGFIVNGHPPEQTWPGRYPILGEIKHIPHIIENNVVEATTGGPNLALGEQRARVVKEYLESLGVSANRMRAVSLGKEAPFCHDANEDCWSRNRRGHFVITGK